MLIQKTKYDAYMAKEYVPVRSEDIPYYVDFRGLRAYAESQGKKVADLSSEEKQQFVRPRL